MAPRLSLAPLSLAATPLPLVALTSLSLVALTSLSCSAGGGGEQRREDGVAQGSGGTGEDILFEGTGGRGTLDGLESREDAGCNRLEVGFEELHPTVVLLIDRSGSMWDYGYGTSATRWDALRDTLMDPAGPVANLQDKVRFGLAAYTSDGAASCPLLEEISVAFGNFDAIQSRYLTLSSRPSFKADTPMGASLAAVARTLDTVTVPGPKVIVLATDGEPDRCDLQDPNCGQDASIRAVQDAFDTGIQTFVIGIGGDIGEQHLRDIANAGVGQPVARSVPPNCDGNTTDTATYAATGGDATFYRPADQSELERDFQDIIGAVRRCQFDLDAEVDLERAYEGNVLLDGEALGHDDPDGWHMVSATRLEITGTACEQILTESQRLSVGFPCGVARIIR